MPSAAITTTKKRERNRRTRVDALTCAPRTTSSSAIVWAICRATTAAAHKPTASMMRCAVTTLRP